MLTASWQTVVAYFEHLMWGGCEYLTRELEYYLTTTVDIITTMLIMELIQACAYRYLRRDEHNIYNSNNALSTSTHIT